MIDRRKVLRLFEFGSLGLLLSQLHFPSLNNQRSQTLVSISAQRYLDI